MMIDAIIRMMMMITLKIGARNVVLRGHKHTKADDSDDVNDDYLSDVSISSDDSGDDAVPMILLIAVMMMMMMMMVQMIFIIICEELRINCAAD